MKQPDEILTPKELAVLFKVTVPWVYQQTHYNKIPSFKVNGHLRFSKNAVLKHFGYDSN
jgi:excisionase family DNA binding protein